MIGVSVDMAEFFLGCLAIRQNLTTTKKIDHTEAMVSMDSGAWVIPESEKGRV
jgi:hypothetical protein